MSATAYQRRRRELAKARQLEEEKAKTQTKRAPKKVKNDVEADK
ncbi:hypothetical protein MKY08_09475 [Lysinibacillus sp. FSL M8-0337]